MERLRIQIAQWLVILRPYTAHLAVAGLALFIGLSAGIYKAMKDPAAVDTADKWPFPLWAPYKTVSLRDGLARINLWAEDPTKAKVVVEKKPEGPPWRFIGTVQDGKARVAVVELEQGKRVQRIASGQPLPNGAVIKKIDTSELIYDENGEEKVLKLFGVSKTDNLAAGSGKK